uniref:Cytosol aminopeptidase domain-containing protein n=1 Tax=Parascaris univalens TaxID=6257 RepID=A0A915CDM5_PARUN
FCSRMRSVQSTCSFLSAPLRLATSLSETTFDGVIIVSYCAKQLTEHAHLQPLSAPISAYLELNNGAKDSTSLLAVDKSIVPSGRLIYSGTGPVTRDHDDVRRFSTATRNAMRLALSAGMKSPILATVPHKKYPQAELVAALGALHELHVPLNIREETGKKNKLTALGLLPVSCDPKKLLSTVEAIEAAFTVCRDVGDSDPQRMAPARVAEYVESAFKDSCIKVGIISDPQVIAREYPLMAAVNRAAMRIEAHRPRLISLEYIPDGPIEETIMLVGKGVTIDTGGADLKTGGAMFGMSRDKYGSAIVAGFFKAIEVLRPKGIKALGCMCMVRNSIGADAYTCDEIIKARSGKRIHIYCTDAEGRITMLDPLTKMCEMAIREKNPHLFTLATLTGHAFLSKGYYASVMDNGPAHQVHTAERIQKCGDEYGQPTEISRLHSEDFAFHEAECECADLRQGNTKPSVNTIRGHQGPAAFLIRASRLDEHGTDSTSPIKFSHIDIGSAMGDYPHVTYPNPLVALLSAFVLPRSD